jgi:regulator of protease activity HflC (stomatin/prohibitin superfamily)
MPAEKKVANTPPRADVQRAQPERVEQGQGAGRAGVLDSVRRAEERAAAAKADAERRAADIVGEGQRSAARVESDAHDEGRIHIKKALEKAAADAERDRVERMLKVKAESDATMAAARARFPELAKSILGELERGKDAED